MPTFYVLLAIVAALAGIDRLISMSKGYGTDGDHVIGFILLLISAVFLVGAGTVAAIKNVKKAPEEKVKPATTQKESQA